jgi:hypothetical protein
MARIQSPGRSPFRTSNGRKIWRLRGVEAEAFAGSFDTGQAVVGDGSGFPSQWSFDAQGHVTASSSNANGNTLLINGVSNPGGVGEEPPFNVVKNGREILTSHETGGVCITTCRDPHWAVVHIYPLTSQTQPLLRITEDVYDYATSELVPILAEVSRRGKLTLKASPVVGAVGATDPLFEVYNSAGVLVFHILNDGTITGSGGGGGGGAAYGPGLIDIDPMADPWNASGFANVTSASFGRYRDYRWGSAGDWIEFPFGCDTHTFSSIDFYLFGRNDQGTGNITIDGVSVGTITATNVDTGGVEVKSSLANVAITGGQHTMRVTAAGGFLGLRHIQFKR